MLAELGLHNTTGSTVYGDNQAAIAVSKNGVKGERTKHVNVKYYFVNETVESGRVELQRIPTQQQQQADIFTKALAAPVFLELRKQLMTGSRTLLSCVSRVYRAHQRFNPLSLAALARCSLTKLRSGVN